MSTVDLLAIFPHPDDAELTCGGTLLKSARQGYRVGIVDLSAGEMASRGSVGLRTEEAARAASILQVSVRENLRMPDSGLANTPETRLKVATVIRRLRPSRQFAGTVRPTYVDLQPARRWRSFPPAIAIMPQAKRSKC
jgi:LmbE family N-acetylglucosaminyl deacetylase